MARYGKCPGCGRKADKNDPNDHFDIYRCPDCGQMFCQACNGGRCSRCGSIRRLTAGTVYAKKPPEDD